MMLNKNLLLAMLAWLMVTAGMAQAAEPQVFGEYTVYHNAFSTNTLQPKMAEAYNIVRSKNRGLLTVSVIKKSMAPVGTPMHAYISASASNLAGQLRNLNVREVDEGASIYYLSEFQVRHEEVLDFNLEIVLEGEPQPLTVKFRQKFYTE